MKFTQEQVMNIIKEEIAAVLGEEVNDQRGPSLPIIPIMMVKFFLADAASPNALTYFEPDDQTGYTGEPTKDVAALQDLPRMRPPANEKALDIFDQRFLPNAVDYTMKYAIEESGVDEKTQSYMKGLFMNSDAMIPGTAGDLNPRYFRMPEIIKLAQVLLESLNSIQIPNPQYLDFTMQDLREINPKLADKIEKELS